jgi:hypothetical protein
VVVGPYSKCDIIPIVVEMFDNCRLLIDGVVPGIDEGLYVGHTAFVKETNKLD